MKLQLLGRLGHYVVGRESPEPENVHTCVYFFFGPLFIPGVFIVWPFFKVLTAYFFFLTHCSFYFTKLWHSRAGSSLRSVQPCLGQGIRYWSCLASIVHASLLNPTPAVYSQWLETFTAWVIHWSRHLGKLREGKHWDEMAFKMQVYLTCCNGLKKVLNFNRFLF